MRSWRLRRLRSNSNLIVDFEPFRSVALGVAWYVLVHDALGHDAMRRVHVVLEQLVHAEGSGADGALVREVRRLQRQVVVPGHVVEQFPLVHLQIMI